MVNGCLVYGVAMTFEELQKFLNYLVHDLYEYDSMKSSYLSKFTEYLASGKKWNDDLEWDLFDNFTSLFEEDERIFLSKNGLCCSVEKDKPYFLGWKSKGMSNHKGSVPIDMLTKSLKKKLKSFCKPIGKPCFYIMAHDCDFCT